MAAEDRNPIRDHMEKTEAERVEFESLVDEWTASDSNSSSGSLSGCKNLKVITLSSLVEN
jgi:hypothetical protein